MQEAIEYADHELLTNRFYVTHYAGCAVLFNKETFFPDVKVKSIYLHDTRHDLPDKVREGESGWVVQGVLSRASFRRQPSRGQKSLTVVSLHINNSYAKIRSQFGSRHGTRRLMLPRDLFAIPMEAASLVIILHGELLQEHFQGLAQTGRYLRSAGLIGKKSKSSRFAK